MTKEELAKMLDGREYRDEISKEEAQLAKQHGLVVVFGASDDLMEFEGAIYDESGSPARALVDAEGLLPERDSIDDDDELEAWFHRKKKAHVIEGIWGKEGYSFTYKTDIPHATFEIFDGGEKYCRGIVFSLADIE